jgi:hypothetical protein
MYRFACIGVALSYLSLWGMDEISEQPSDISVTMSSVVAAAAVPRDSSKLYVPENVDVTCCLEESTKLCYVLHGLCKFGIGVCELTSLICGGIGITEIKDRPGVAWGLGLASTISEGATLGLTYALFQMDKKMRKLDRAVGEARRRRMMTEV